MEGGDSHPGSDTGDDSHSWRGREDLGEPRIMGSAPESPFLVGGGSVMGSGEWLNLVGGLLNLPLPQRDPRSPEEGTV